MRNRNHYLRLLMGTALVTPFALSAWAQTGQIDQSTLPEKSAECRTLAETVETREQPLADDARTRVVAAVNNDRTEECVTLSRQLQANATNQNADQDTDQASEQLSEQVDLSKQVEILDFDA